MSHASTVVKIFHFMFYNQIRIKVSRDKPALKTGNGKGHCELLNIIITFYLCKRTLYCIICQWVFFMLFDNCVSKYVYLKWVWNPSFPYHIESKDHWLLNTSIVNISIQTGTEHLYMLIIYLYLTRFKWDTLQLVQKIVQYKTFSYIIDCGCIQI